MTKKIIQGLYSGVKTEEIDTLAAETSFSFDSTSLEYQELASRIFVSNLHKKTPSKFSDSILLQNKFNVKGLKEKVSYVRDDIRDYVLKHKDVLDAAIKHENDYFYKYNGCKILERSYLIKIDGKIKDRPQYMLMRVALEIFSQNMEQNDDIETVIMYYNLMSERKVVHATPTLFNSSTNGNFCNSCYLLTMKEDSIDGIYETLKRTALISKAAGGVGLDITPIRASTSYIRGTNGSSNGIVPMLKVYNDTARYVDQVFLLNKIF